MILSGGQNVYPADIEIVMLGHPDVAEIAVIAVPSEKWGETPLAVVVPRAGTQPGPGRAHRLDQRARRAPAAHQRRGAQGLAAAQSEWQDPEARAARGTRPSLTSRWEHP